MKLTVTTLSGELYMLDVGAEMELENLKALCEYESSIPAREMVVMHEGRPLLDDKRSLSAHSIKDGDVLLIQHLVPPQPSQASSSSGEGSRGVKGRAAGAVPLGDAGQFRAPADGALSFSSPKHVERYLGVLGLSADSHER